MNIETIMDIETLCLIKGTRKFSILNREKFFNLFLNLIIRNSFIYSTEIEKLRYLIMNFNSVESIELCSHEIKSESFYSQDFEYEVKFILKDDTKPKIIIKNDNLYYGLNSIYRQFERRLLIDHN